MSTLEIILPDKKRLQPLPTHFIQYSSMLRAEYERDRKTSNKPIVEIYLPHDLNISETVGNQIISFLLALDSVLSTIYQRPKVDSPTNATPLSIGGGGLSSSSSQPMSSSSYSSSSTSTGSNTPNHTESSSSSSPKGSTSPIFTSAKQYPIIDNDSIKLILKKIVKNRKYIPPPLPVNLSNDTFEQILSPTFEEDQFVSLEDTHSLSVLHNHINNNNNNNNYNDDSNEMKNICFDQRDVTIKEFLYNTVSVKGKGYILDTWILCAHYFDIIGNLLIKSVRFQLERLLTNAASADEARYLLDISCDFEPETMFKIETEDNFSKSYGDSPVLSLREEPVVDNSQSSHSPVLKHTSPHQECKPSKKNMQLSTIFETNRQKDFKPDIVLDVKNRRLYKAIKDSTTLHCHKCRAEFNLLNRKHHCRECGYIFCSSCTNNSIQHSSIPSPKYTSSKDYFYRKLRVCSDCFSNLVQHTRYGTIHQSLELMALKFPIVRKFSSLRVMWRQASVAYMSSIREIQYCFPTHQFEPFERESLWRNRKYLEGHSKWIVKLVESIDWRGIDQQKLEKILKIVKGCEKTEMNCYYLMCSSSCCSTIPIKDVFPLLDENITCQEIRKFAVDILKTIDCDDDLIYFLPQLVYYLRFEKSVERNDLKEYLFDKSLKSPRIAHFLLWELNNCQTSKEYFHKYEVFKCELLHNHSMLQATKNDKTTQSYIYGVELLNILKSIPPYYGPEFDVKKNEISNLINRQVRTFNPRTEKYEVVPIEIRYPIDPSYVIKEFFPDRMTIKDSATRPIKMVFRCLNTDTKKEEIFDLIFKKDDVRKDRIILNIISVMKKILQEKINDIRKLKMDHKKLFDSVMDSIYSQSHTNAIQAFSSLSKLHNILSMVKNTQIENIVKADYDPEHLSMLIDSYKKMSTSVFTETISKMKTDFFNCYEDFDEDMEKVLDSIVTYRVLPCNNEYGFIEVVQNAETLCKINETSIPTYFKERNSSNSIHPCIQSFKRSLASWMVITHLLGVGDRHNENIMITYNGYFFHIDYGFILGKEPKPISNFLRFSDDFTKTIESTENIETFKKLSTLVFSILRKEAPFFLYHLMFLNKLDPVLDNSSRFSQTYIQDEVANRFFPGLPTKIAEQHFERLLDIHKDSLQQYITDTSRAISKKAPQITKSTIGYLSHSMANLSSYIINFQSLYRNENNNSNNNNNQQ
ncbi:phosphatidylinositol 3-kinase [Cavenderia fasciculata]|uniref:Phosphatidylinositol 3-kinase n=1 Tax=Cavenderia fasciculata TaxID=261658 RepID=F4PZL5_CACFS|nr:phosphatidylinositol 3-kinase [Cavenderia fasciculata]EGG18779.1 phosphatidylinositol 3-kinase [Cavenderia fasciculata]|eukprot:XP_004357241.1 phosphatidylinositol 3-kinase [Cavenderia fasciculata]